MICFPNAKINLGLHVVGKRPDGYHNIETLFYPIPLRDALEVVEAESFSFSQTGVFLDCPVERNLVIKALRLIEERYPLPPLEVHLLKKIPFGAGLGGGSSDAACMLKLLNDFGKLNLANEQLEEMASVLGADCPFFIRNTPVYATGTGTIFEPVSLSLEGYYMCLIKPDVYVSTPEAYAGVAPKPSEVSLKDIIRMDISEWKGLLVNDFESSVFNNYPLIKDIKESLYRQGAIYAAMSGSGSAVFGLFKEPTSLKKDYPDCFVWECELR